MQVFTGSAQARVKNQEDEKRETGEKQGLTQSLVGLTNKTNWQQTKREHGYNEEDG
jgi:hypothetical protein